MHGVQGLLSRAGPLICGAALLLGTAVPAAAAWATTGTGQGAVSARTMPQAAGATATCLGAGSVRITWSASTLATSYTVQRSVAGSAWTTRGTATGLSYDDPVASVVALSVRWRVIATRTSWSGPASDPTATRTVGSLSCA